MFNKVQLGNRVNIVIDDAGIIEGKVVMVSANKKDIVLEDIEYISSCYSGQEWINEPVVHITEEEVHDIQIIA